MLSRKLKERYNIIRELGAGGFGKTYLAEDTQRPGMPHCVVKQLMPACNEPRFLQVARRLFQVEAEILEQLGRHDQIPQLLAYFEEDNEFYLIEEFIAGPALNEELLHRKRLAVPEVIKILRSILQTLVYVHQQGVIHRDIKPSNIIRRQQDNQLVLIDFGSVKQIQPQVMDDGQGGPALTTLTIAIGTGGYAPLEQLAGQPRFNSDIYALGIVAIQCLTGISPKQLKQDPQTGKILWRSLIDIEEPLAAILERMIRCLCTERYQSAAEVLADLETLENSGNSLLATPPRVDPRLVQPPLVAPLRAPSPAFSQEARTQLQDMMMDLVGPIGSMILQQALERSSSLTELIANLSTHLPHNQLTEFKAKARTYLQRTTIQPATDLATTLEPQELAISGAFVQQCQEVLIELVGPIARLLIQKVLRSNPNLSEAEMMEVLAAEISDPKKAAEFYRRLEPSP
jgi:serine/threonine protein kinase